MSDFPTALAELGQGALTARAVEPAAGGADVSGGDGHTHESVCLNCGTRLIGSHCHACGQAAHVHRTIGAFFHDLAHGIFHVEGKIWRTLPLLVWQPGRLTREYIDGRRASYVSPIAMFLFAVFLLFAAIHMVEGSGKDAAIYTSPDAATIAMRAKVSRLVVARGAARSPAEVAAIDRRIEAAKNTVLDIGVIKVVGSPDEAAADDAELRRQLPFVAHAVEVFRANPEFAIYKLQMTAYKYSWLLIPMSVPFVWLLFPFSQRFHLYDHTVFVTYSLAFMTLLNVVIALAGAAGVPFLQVAGTLIPPVHMYRQLRGTYATSIAGTLWRTAALCLFAIVVIGVFALALLSVELAD